MVQAPTTQPTKRSTGVVAIAVGAIIVLAGLGFGILRMNNGDLPTETEKVEYIAQLEATVLPIAEGLQIAYFMDEPECAILTYPRGDFVDGDPRLCGGSTDNPVAFDEMARADHGRIVAGLEASGTPIERIGGELTVNGQVVDLWFSSTGGAPFATSWSLEYDPESRLRPGTVGIVTRSPVGGEDDWWFACCSD